MPARRRTSRPAGVVILIVREDLLGHELPITPEGHEFRQARRGGQHAQHAELLTRIYVAGLYLQMD